MDTKICRHFGDCGGCSFQNIPYQQQLSQKEEAIRGFMAESGIDTALKPINGSALWFYRNKMEFCFGGGEDFFSCGLYRKGNNRQVVDLNECLIFSRDTPAIFTAVKDFAYRHNYSVYNKFNYRGFLRHLILKETKFTGQLMAGVVTTSQNSFVAEEFTKILTDLSLNSSIRSIYHIINDSKSDAVVFEKKNLIFGSPFIQEALGDLKFNIGIDTFFQVNPAAIFGFYTKIKEYARLTPQKSVLDLFCGAGSIGIFLASDAKYVWGVELSPAIVEAAWENAKANNINNISFVVSDAKAFLKTQGHFHKDIDLLIINPPRSGVSPKVIREILKLNAKKIIYSSCNPGTLFSDLNELAKEYNVEFIEPFDFFPHTPHIECLAILVK